MAVANRHLSSIPRFLGVTRRSPSVLRPWRRESHGFALIFIAPAVAIVGLVSIYPVLDALDLSLHATQFTQRLGFVGLANYRALLADTSIWRDAFNSFVYTAGSLLVVLPYSMGIALLLSRRSRWAGLFRTIIIVPWIVSQTITALLWGWLLNPDFGPATYFVQTLIGERVAMLATPMNAMTSVILVNVWVSYPLATLLFLAAIQTIPAELFEAARVDGASPLAQFRHITLPMIQSTTLVVMIQLTLQYFNMVTLIYVMTGGGPLGGTETLALRVLKMSFENWDLGRGAALGLILTVINLLFSLLYMRSLRSTG